MRCCQSTPAHFKGKANRRRRQNERVVVLEQTKSTINRDIENGPSYRHNMTSFVFFPRTTRNTSSFWDSKKDPPQAGYINKEGVSCSMDFRSIECTAHEHPAFRGWKSVLEECLKVPLMRPSCTLYCSGNISEPIVLWPPGLEWEQRFAREVPKTTVANSHRSLWQHRFLACLQWECPYLEKAIS